MSVGCCRDVFPHVLSKHLQVHHHGVMLQPCMGTYLHCPLYMTRDRPCVQAGHSKNQLNVPSSCEETDAMEDLSSLRSGCCKKKVLRLSCLAAKLITACETLDVSVSGSPGRPSLVSLQCLQRA